MKITTIIVIILSFSIKASPQNVNLDLNTFRSWPTITNATISNDGKYVSYSLNQGMENGLLVVKSTNHEWEKIFDWPDKISFSENSKK